MHLNIQEKQFIIVIIDDFHCIHTIQDPKYNETSTCIHMTTEIVDIHPGLPAIKLPHNSIHRVVEVNNNRCVGGIGLENLQQFMKQSLRGFFEKNFLEGIPEYQNYSMENAKQSAEHLR